ncbi:TPA_exp: Uncharacterized protein A8136_2949 [Trichophyton benhamiae CBS 112371]|uniref:Flavoprotein domain-containing protein n=1 Tax=Arthroderma benhamiae (strain ATCC MYA-4681 / CBS 112371) TaxID=663331 RepID=D4ALV8_ARTBC|nr:uncharacterized protein ARB_05306 [Trichophyton benhamiae CBS 112371]EFE36367.1 hypothetical protein ARB_05306 [Trichophyton benhamiae CBS 112371]DAA79164.1 TPA_exp: Uncharacterized protein A8136_2949 [Trichophyton benhamiae CBS 112371]
MQMAVGVKQMLNGERLDSNPTSKFEIMSPAHINASPRDANPCHGEKRPDGTRLEDCMMDGQKGIPSLGRADRHTKRVILATSTPFADTIVRSLYRDPDVELRLIVPQGLGVGQEEMDNVECYEDAPQRVTDTTSQPLRGQFNMTAANLADWADLLIISPMDAGTLGSMVCGLTTSLTLTLLRGWDVSKSIILVPGMTTRQWVAPITRRHLDDIQVFWPWVKVLPPILSKFEAPDRLAELPWDGRESFYDEIKKALGWSVEIGIDGRNTPSQEVEIPGKENGLNEKQNGMIAPPIVNLQSSDSFSSQTTITHPTPTQTALPSEILSMIFEALGDWETAAAVGIYTRLPTPDQWKALIPRSHSSQCTLEYAILKRPFSEIEQYLSSASPWKPLSSLSAHLILKFSRIDILDFIITSRSDIFWSTPRLLNLPFRASAIYGNTALLDWWLHCPELPKKDYLTDAMDSASRAGYIHVLDWWRNSGLPLLYTERALESASAEGHIPVLSWWRNASECSPEHSLPLKVGKSVLLAAQSGRTNSIAWWDQSGIPYSYTESVARIASTHGHVHVLELWYKLKGTKMIFDNQVLVGATKNGHVDVLEWWRRSGLHVEFKTCDIEEALEDAIAGSGEKVRRWWERNGLNLGVGTSEWMKVKVL